MLLSAASVILLLTLGQTDGPRDPGTGTGTGTGDVAKSADAPSTDNLTGPPGIPFMPSVGLSASETSGVLLDVALMSAVRARTLDITDSSATWGTDLEVTPGIALEVVTPSLKLSVGYAPRLSIPVNVGTLELAVLNRATLLAVWRADALWSVTAEGIFVFGDYSQLIPASTPGGPGPPPPVLNPVRSFETYPYVGIDAWLRAEGILSARSRIRLALGYFDVGGTGPVGEANQPRAWGPQGDSSFSWDASRNAVLRTAANFQEWNMTGSEYFFLVTLTEGWSQSWTPDFQTTLSGGVGLANRDVETQTAAGHLVPVALASLTYGIDTQKRFKLSLNAGLTPYFDTYARIPYQRITAGASLDWRPSDAWQVEASLNAAFAPYTVKAPESYGTAGLSASFAPVRFLVLSAGAFTQAQIQGDAPTTGAFRQWTAYLSLALRDRFSL